MRHKYTDEQGNIVLTVSSSIPGLTFVPPGLTAEDATPLTEVENRDFKEKHRNNDVPALTNDDLTKLVLKLQADIDKLTKKAG